MSELIKEGERLVPHGGHIFSGYNGDMQAEYIAWRLQALSLIGELGSQMTPLLKDIERDKQGPYFFQDSAQRVLGALKAAAKIVSHSTPAEKKTESKTKAKQLNASSNKAFIVHGHDEILLQQAARFLEKLRITPVILFEQPGKGQTIIEKFENNSDVPFAIVLFTPDDLGRAAKETELHPRARQNVVLELGYFVGKLGRAGVAVLYHESIELPSDYRGVEYIKIDPEGAWKMKLAREMKAAGLAVDMNLAI
ncbi:MAG: nucleotide-binding protein [Elusimicrobiota bacterium]